MNIIEVKNNLVKLSYDENVTLASFIKITDLKSSYIAQISHLESSRIGKIAVARLLFNFKNGILAYDGSVPSIQADVEVLSNDFFVNNLDKTEPLLLGKINHTDTDVVVSAKLLKDKPIICAEKSYQCKQLIENLIYQNELNDRKTVVFDTTGEISGNKLVATKNFKLPLNSNSIDYIFDRGFDDLTKENKAFIQDIFSELNDYIKTVEYIPFNDFNSVIDYEFKRTQQLQLIILKNRLTQFEKKGIFAQQKQEFQILGDSLDKNNNIVIDISRLSDSLQVEYIEYVYSQMEKHNTNYYSILMLNNNNSSAGLLNRVFGGKNIFTSIVCSYSYKYLKELKQCSKNMFMFTPIKQQTDFGAYNIFLNKLAEDEFILYGKSTKFTPLIVKGINVVGVDIMLEPAQPEVVEGVNKEVNGVNDGVNDIVEEPLESEIVSVQSEPVEEEDVNNAAETIDSEIVSVQSEPLNVDVEPVINPAQDEIEIVEDVLPDAELTTENQEVVSDITETVDETQPVMDSLTEDIEQDSEEEIQDSEQSSEPLMEQDSAPEPAPEQNISFAETFSNVSIDIDNEELKSAISDRNEINDLLAQIQQSDPNAKPLNTEDMIQLQTVEAEPVQEPANEEDEEEELTDEDLDMIESLDVVQQPAEEVGKSTLPENITNIVEDVESSESTETKADDMLLSGLQTDLATPDTVVDDSDEIIQDQKIETDTEEIQVQEQLVQEEPVIEIVEDLPEPEPEKPEPEQPKQEKKHQSITDEILEEEARKRAEEEAQKPDPIEEQIEKPASKSKIETKSGSTPMVPVYSAEIPDEDIVESDDVVQGDQIMHAEFGRGVVEKIINYGERQLCSVNFEQVGRRLLDPKVSEIKKI